VPGFARFTVDGREHVWMDLQIPLYLWALEQARGSGGGVSPAAVTCGYFHLPKAIGDTGVALWADYSTEWHAAALRCAHGVAAAVEARHFWPPAESVDHDEFAALFHHGVAASVAPEFAGAREARP
jgi:ATP-dependent helicase/nuclease subunit B